MRALPLLAVVGLLVAAPAPASQASGEIEFLLNAVGTSGCTFIRNGKSHSAEAAEAHLRMKYRRGKRHATSTEAFIERLASASSMTRKPYYVRCDSPEAMTSETWFKARLAEYREQNQP